MRPGARRTEDKKNLADFIELRFEGFPNAKWNDALDQPRIRAKLVKAKDQKAISHHTDLCVQLDSDNLDSQVIRIPAGFTSELSEPVSTFLFHAVKIKKGEAWAWELKNPDAECKSESKEKIALVYKDENPPWTVIVLPFTSFAFLVSGALIGTLFESKQQWDLLDRLWKAVRAQFTITRGLQVLLFILVVPALWSALVRLEYADEVCQFFSHLLLSQVCLSFLALLLGFFLEMGMSSWVKRWLQEG